MWWGSTINYKKKKILNEASLCVCEAKIKNVPYLQVEGVNCDYGAEWKILR